MQLCCPPPGSMYDCVREFGSHFPKLKYVHEIRVFVIVILNIAMGREKLANIVIYPDP